MLNIRLQGTNLDLTEEIKSYVNKKLSHLEQYIDPKDESFQCDVEVEKTTDHHKQGDIYRAEVNLHIAGSNFRAESRAESIFAAFDEVKDEMSKELRRNKDKRMTLIRKGGAQIKNMLKRLRF